MSTPTVHRRSTVIPVHVGRRHYEVVRYPTSRFPHVYRVLRNGDRRTVRHDEALNAVRAARKVVA